MTGPEHYREAEQLLARADKGGSNPYGEDPYGGSPDRMIAAANVHAKLAIAAATALTGYLDTETATTDELAWTKAANGGTGVLA